VSVLVRELSDVFDEWIVNFASTFIYTNFILTPKDTDDWIVAERGFWGGAPRAIYSGYLVDFLIEGALQCLSQQETQLQDNPLLAYLCRAVEALKRIKNIEVVERFAGTVTTIAGINNLTAIETLELLERASIHGSQFKNLMNLSKILEDVSFTNITPTTFLKTLVGAKKKTYHIGKYSFYDDIKNLTRAVVGMETKGQLHGTNVAGEYPSLGNSDVKTQCLLMPGSTALDLDQMILSDVIDLNVSSVILVEKDRREANNLVRNISYPLKWYDEGDEDPGLKLYIGDFKNLPPIKCDFAWFDLTGTLDYERSRWLYENLFQSWEEGLYADIWFTLSLVPRNNKFMFQLDDLMPPRVKQKISFEEIDWELSHISESMYTNIVRITFLMEQIFSKYTFQLKIYPYKSKKSYMALVHVGMGSLRRAARPNYLF